MPRGEPTGIPGDNELEEVGELIGEPNCKEESLGSMSEGDLAKRIEDNIAEASKLAWEIFNTKKEMDKLYAERPESPQPGSRKEFRQKRDEFQRVIEEKKEVEKVLDERLELLGEEYGRKTGKGESWFRGFKFPEMPPSERPSFET